jgi:MSHA biogenesis protein MshJ
MIEGVIQYRDKFNSMSLRERALIVVTIVTVMVFLWWHFYAASALADINRMQQDNSGINQEINNLQLAAKTIERQVNSGVNSAKKQQLVSLRNELKKADVMLQQKTLELIDPNEMFDLMQQLIFAESGLKLTALKRKQVTPAFPQAEEAGKQPEIYRHVMQMSFEGSFQEVLNYIIRLENLDWKLIWDRIVLKTGDYPVINADIEISTLSDSQHWVGL